MIYSIKSARWKGPLIVITWGGQVVMAPAAFDDFIGRSIGVLLFWLENKKIKWTVKQ